MKREKRFCRISHRFSRNLSRQKYLKIWAEIQSDAYKKGNPIETADAWVASVALLFDIPLVTHNRRHFENVENLQIISESGKS